MQVSNPFSSPGNWYKGNLHTHTTNSDGEHLPEVTAELYRAEGYDFLSITDHSFVTELASPSEDLLLLLGTELDGDVSEIGETFHVVGFGLTRGGEVPRSPKVGEAITWVLEHGGEAVLAHPYWSGLTYRDLLRWEGHLGIEVFNMVCEGMIAKGHSSVHWDDLLSRGKLLWGLAVDDCHRAIGLGYAAVMVKAAELTRDAIMEAMRTGGFYSTTGPTIEDVVLDGDQIHVRTSPVKQINFMSQSWLGQHHRAPEGETITEATFTPRGEERYVRLEVCDADGWRAWTNPVVFREAK